MVKIGSVGWTDLTVDNASEVRDFYKEVVGFGSAPVNMGDYDDFNMVSPTDGQPQVGVCHARGANKDIPPVWIVYFMIEDMDASVKALQQKGGQVLVGPKAMGNDRYAIIKDPAGAVCGLYQQAEPAD